MTNSHLGAPQLGGKAAVILFVATLLAFVTESQLTQYVQTTLDYRHPFFLFYIVHSTFTVVFPLHVALLVSLKKDYTMADLQQSLTTAVVRHIGTGTAVGEPGLPRFPTSTFAKFILVLTAGVTTPGLLWFAAVSMASLSDVTAIWNANAFFAYVFTVKVFRLKWESRKLFAVILATLGVLAVVYGGSVAQNDGTKDAPIAARTARFKPSAPLIGDLLTLAASVGYGLYQVMYKKYAALPSDPEYEAMSPTLYTSLSDAESETDLDDRPRRTAAAAPDDDLPFGLYANLLTGAIGVCTMLVLWIPLPVLHYLDIESFALPPNSLTVVSIAGIALSGMVYNAGFMVLLGVWGPIVVSVGYLLVIVLVFLSDLVFGEAWQTVTMWSLSGAGAIVVAFGVLALDMVKPA